MFDGCCYVLTITDPVEPPSSESVYATGESLTSSHPLEDNDRVSLILFYSASSLPPPPCTFLLVFL